ncbi:MAG: redoxin domain-containing protein [Pseudaminobacter sp.]|nr:redoxin domain-containing protein [Pseudaminobacter sp.]
MTHHIALPGSLAPELLVPSLHGTQIDLATEKPDNFTAVFFYRGVHCPMCKTQLEELNRRVGEFSSRGISVLAVSMDSEERVKKQADQWSVGNLKVGYGLSEADARAWGLFISRKEKDAEPERFAEPGIAIIYPDGHIYALFQQSVPFARPRLEDLLKGLDFVIEKQYPARGTLAA